MRKAINFLKSTMLLGISLMSLLFFSACQDPKEEPTPVIPDKESIVLSQDKIDFDRISSSHTITVTTNISDIKCKVNSTAESWCTATYSNKSLTVTLTTNDKADSRITTIVLEGGKINKSLTITQKGMSSSLEGLKDDVEVPVSSGSATSFQPGAGIEASFDGDYSTIYHSQWLSASSPEGGYLPITLMYNFADAQKIDYLVYTPRPSGSTGNFKALEVWVATEDNPTLTKYGDYDFQGTTSPSRINFSPALIKPTKIQFIVKTGEANSAACAEMDFYTKNTQDFDPLSIFTDQSCSAIKSGIQQSDIDKIPIVLYKEIASQLFKGTYDSEFRIQQYRAYQHPSVNAKITRTNTYSLRDNPTGIYANFGEDIIVLCGDLHNQNISLFIQDPDKKMNGSSYTLSPGLNKLKAKNSGLMYVMYHTQTGTEASVKLNFATGNVNGYFDSQKHTKDDWNRILDKANFRHFDVLGKRAHLTFETNKFRQHTPDGLALINKYDDLVSREEEFMGLVKYRKAFQNRSYFLVVYDSFMYSTSYYTGYVNTVQDLLCDINKLNSDPWGPAHEIGHSNQTRPGLNWIGTTEVTNNIFSQEVQIAWNGVSRVQNNGGYSGYLSKLAQAPIAFNAEPDVLFKLVPFWQLKIYLQDVAGQPDFYKDLYEKCRTMPIPSTAGGLTQGVHQLNFVRIVCEISNYDLTEFFEFFGFLTPIDQMVDDYAKEQFTITQAQIDDLKAEIASKNYPKPPHKVQYITDNTISAFQQNRAIVKGAATLSGDDCTLAGWSNVAAFEIHKDGKLFDIHIKDATVKLSGDKGAYKIYAVAADGTKVLADIK